MGRKRTVSSFPKLSEGPAMLGTRGQKGVAEEGGNMVVSEAQPTLKLLMGEDLARESRFKRTRKREVLGMELEFGKYSP